MTQGENLIPRDNAPAPCWLEVLLFVMAALAIFAAAWWLNPAPAGALRLEATAAELAAGRMPRSNFYPPGAALAWLPFRGLPQGALLAALVYFAVGSVCFLGLCQLVRSLAWRVVAYAGFLGNLYFFWTLKSSQDLVFEFAALMAAMLALARGRALLFALLAVPASLMRATDAIALLAVALVLLLATRRPRWLAFPLLYLGVMAINYTTYGSPAPALNGGVNTYLGNHPYYIVGHPRFDIDVLLEPVMERPPIPPGASERAADAAWRQAGLRMAAAHPAQTLYGVLGKTCGWLFNFEKIPNLAGEFRLGYGVPPAQAGEGGLAAPAPAIQIRKLPGQRDLLAAALYTFYRLGFVPLLACALLWTLCSGRLRRLQPAHVLLVPLLATLPIVWLTFPDTRFKLVYDVLALPAMALGGQWLFACIRQAEGRVAVDSAP